MWVKLKPVSWLQQIKTVLVKCAIIVLGLWVRERVLKIGKVCQSLCIVCWVWVNVPKAEKVWECLLKTHQVCYILLKVYWKYDKEQKAEKTRSLQNVSGI
jgi:hypothetical protein